MNTTSPPPRVQVVSTGAVFCGARTEVRSGRTTDGVAVMVKSPAVPIPDASELARYRRERAFLDALAGPGIPAVLDLIEGDGTVRLVMTSQGGRSLADVMAERRLPTSEALTVLEEAASTLARVHAAGVVHKDVDPANLVWGGRAGTLQLVDFGSSMREGESTSAGHLEGTLRYISPEATGRSGHAVTWRADLYSLGVTAWHLLVGRPPFDDDDALRLVHAHLARVPQAPHEADPTVPPCLSAIVLRLMEKDPERRYQSAEGLAADLRRCRERLARGELQPFELAADDVPPRFAIPERLYGRHVELAALTLALEHAGAGGVSLVLVEGPSGIGKSALVGELADRGRRMGARFVHGRFEQLGRDTPLKALSEACDALVAGLLATDELTLGKARDRLRSALGDSAALLAPTIPSLRALLGDLPAPPELGGHASAFRAMRAHAGLLGALASPAQPVVAFLDDLQWADLASLDLMEFLVGAEDIRGLLLIGGYRDDEVGAAHPLARIRDRLEAGGTPVTRVRPGPLDLAATAALVADACRCTADVAGPLAAALRERTGGNPFFLRTRLLQMFDRGLLRRRGTGWAWSDDALEGLGFADNVVDAVLERITALPAETARALGVAARVGNRFDLRLVAHALARPEAEVAASLAPGIAAGLIRPEGDGWGLLAWGGDARSQSDCHFVHDRVQEAALRLLPTDDAAAVHLRLAQRLTRDGAPTGEALFDALEHYRASLARLTDDECVLVARLALDACAEAMRSAAFDVALRACELGLLALGQRDAALREALCTRAVEVADASADNDAIERHTAALIAGASSLVATAPAYAARIRAQTRANQIDAAIATANDFLARVGRRVRTQMRVLPLLGKLVRVLWSMRGQTPEALVDRPEATDPLRVAALRIQIAIAPALATGYPHVLPLDMLTHLDHVLTHGVTPDGLFVWTGWSMLLAEATRRPERAIRYCELALARAERMGARASWAGIAQVLYAVLSPWRTRLPVVAEALVRTRDRALELGEVSSAIATGFLADQIGFFQGKALAEVELALRHTETIARQYRFALAPWTITPFRQAVAALRGVADPEQAPDFSASMGAFADQSQAVSRLIHAIFLGDRDAGWQAARDVPATMNTPLRSPVHFIWWTYRAIALLRAAAVGLVTPGEARRLVRPGRRLLERWAKAFPARRFRILWIDAADAALRGQNATALARYEEAIELARSLGVGHDAALMSEHAAEVAAAAGQPRLRSVFLEEARAGYRQWGAERKVERLSQLLPPRPTTTSSTSRGGDLDLETLFRASLALSGELRLDRLVGEVVAVAIQNAGATRGFLVVEREGELVVEVGRDADGAALVAPGTRLAGARVLATTVVQYVARTGEQLVLADGAVDPRFAPDPYLQDGAAASILCMPLDHNGRRTGIVYLENHLVAGSFTPARLKTIHVLASQAAVAIQNASLVDNLEARVEERTQALTEALERTRSQHRQLEESHHALVQSEKLAALGQLVAGVAHELNSPLGAIRASVDNLSSAVNEGFGELLDLLGEVPPTTRAAWVTLVRHGSAPSLSRTSREQRAARRTLAARLDAAGITDADVLATHLTEIGLGGDDDLTPYDALLRADQRGTLIRGAYNVTAIARNGQNIRIAADRAAKIVFALKSYSHPGDAEGACTRASLADNLDTVFTLYHSQLKHNIDLTRDYQDRGEVDGHHDELNQVWTNLVHNALHAMDGKGRLEASVRSDGEAVVVTITDSGRGIPPSQLARIFEPFFTTKPAGEGSGLGLSISREIVDQHGGHIDVDSEPGRTRFTVRLPWTQPKAVAPVS